MKKPLTPTFVKFMIPIGISILLFLLFNIISASFVNHKMLYILLFCTSSTLLTCFLVHYIFKGVKRPINLMNEAIKTNNMDLLFKTKLTGSFKTIADHIYDSNTQREELQKAKEKAEESDLLKASFLTNLSHEIRTPMNAILGFSDLLANENITEKEKIEFITVIRRSGKNLVSIIDDLIEMSKIETKQVKPNHSAFNLDEVLNGIKQTVEITIPQDKTLDIKYDQPKHPVVFQTISDLTKLKQIIVNLLSNSIKYTEKGIINFGYKINAESNAIEFYVTDTGIGIPKDKFKSIFSRFHRIQNDKTINLSGLGLGLSICKAYVKMLGGKIWVESEEGKGTSFSFTIPLKLSGLPATPKTETPINTLDKVKPLTVLIAEDDAINFMLIKRVMTLRNYTVLRASNGEEAVEICNKNNNIQLVIMDIKMPKMDGFEARKAIKQFKPYLPVIAHTAYTSAEVNSKAYDAGFIDCISKPLSKTKLFKTIDRIQHLTPDPVLS